MIRQNFLMKRGAVLTEDRTHICQTDRFNRTSQMQ